jgi:hypothetical protein
MDPWVLINETYKYTTLVSRSSPLKGFVTKQVKVLFRI